MILNDNAIDYEHWDDPNELVDRLRLLDASHRAGNNAHDNEMLSIIEELREAVRRYDDLWQADVVDMRPYSGFNRGHHYILTVIDVLSKYTWAVPLKGGSETANAIAEIVRESRRYPKNLQTDMGKEFYNADVLKILKRHDFNHYSTYSTLKASMVERFNHTLKNDMWKMFTLNGNYKWVDDYNARKHRTIGMRCAEVQRTNPLTYLLEDYRGKSVAGAFYEYELHRATHPDVYLMEKVLRRKGNKVYVK
ncbi:YMD3 protein, partial [Pseudoatta argentina]